MFMITICIGSSYSVQPDELEAEFKVIVQLNFALHYRYLIYRCAVISVKDFHYFDGLVIFIDVFILCEQQLR